ncbi:Peptidyl-prolyl cis-trans isomerase B [Rhodobacteraceae bacterium THAF1]|uniref:peptidylprolyl isomerase n=1 Tax=Palleronia sp. THAF1 TaxID=2587842 RepID=UPI000F3E5F0C|nr:peptidylprolyl isomerase [Palleronia sp. THAF1]QFU08277.1 Peptidyl-prolyl cis-trans isomerase B [Palleronia sp. THAF1]VDC28867.1 Peptidyl-prolyl cis-trans isomerase B [Rhodobacteraceae bacterium THAF1]
MRSLAILAAICAAPAFATGIDLTIADKGTVSIDLFEDVAPNHVDRITALARNGAYDGVVFHRVIDGFMAQTGDVQFGRADLDTSNAGMGGSDMPDLAQEFSDRPFERGTVGMARSGNSVDSANSQFFIMFQPAPHLNGQYTVVGQVTDGMDVVHGITRGQGRGGSVADPDVIESVTVTE